MNASVCTLSIISQHVCLLDTFEYLPIFEQSDVTQAPASQESLSIARPSHFADVIKPPALAETG